MLEEENFICMLGTTVMLMSAQIQASNFCFVSLLSQNPKAFLESYEEMLRYALKQETWPTTQQELEGRGVGKDIVFTELQRS